MLVTTTAATVTLTATTVPVRFAYVIQNRSMTAGLTASAALLSKGVVITYALPMGASLTASASVLTERNTSRVLTTTPSTAGLTASALLLWENEPTSLHTTPVTARLTSSSAGMRRKRSLTTLAASVTLTATVASPVSSRPNLTGIDIASGPAGTLVVLSGSSFDNTVDLIMFGTVSAGSNYSVISDTEIAVFVPGGGTGTVDVMVANDGGTATLASAWTWDAYEGGPGGGGGSVPVVSDLYNNDNPGDPHVSAYDDGRGGDSVTITGTGFTTARNVYFGTVQVEFTVTPGSDTEITATAPPLGDNGDYIVEVYVESLYGISGDSGSANDFTYPGMPLPSITSNSPTTGIAGTLVLIEGDNLIEVTGVQLGGYDAVFNVLNDETVQMWVPYGPTPDVDSEIYVINPAGISTTHGHFMIWGVPQGLTVTPMANAVQISWSAVSDSLHASYRVYGDVNNPPDTPIATTAQTSIVYPVDHALAYYYAVSYIDEQGNESAKCTAVGPISSLETIADVIADGAIDAMSMFATGSGHPR